MSPAQLVFKHLEYLTFERPFDDSLDISRQLLLHLLPGRPTGTGQQAPGDLRVDRVEEVVRTVWVESRRGSGGSGG